MITELRFAGKLRLTELRLSKCLSVRVVLGPELFSEMLALNGPAPATGSVTQGVCRRGLCQKTLYLPRRDTDGAAQTFVTEETSKGNVILHRSVTLAAGAFRHSEKLSVGHAETRA